MLRNRIRRRRGRARRLLPFDVLRGGTTVETWIHFEQYCSGRIEARSYLLQVKHPGGDEVVLSCDLRRGDDERQVLVAHWRTRQEVRRDLQRRSGPLPMSVWVRRRR